MVFLFVQIVHKLHSVSLYLASLWTKTIVRHEIKSHCRRKYVKKVTKFTYKYNENELESYFLLSNIIVILHGSP